MALPVKLGKEIRIQNQAKGWQIHLHKSLQAVANLNEHVKYNQIESGATL